MSGDEGFDPALATDQPGDSSVIAGLRAQYRRLHARVADVPKLEARLAHHERETVLRSPEFGRLSARQKQALADMHEGEFTHEVVAAFATELWPNLMPERVAAGSPSPPE